MCKLLMSGLKYIWKENNINNNNKNAKKYPDYFDFIKISNKISNIMLEIYS